MNINREKRKSLLAVAANLPDKCHTSLTHGQEPGDTHPTSQSCEWESPGSRQAEDRPSTGSFWLCCGMHESSGESWQWGPATCGCFLWWWDLGTLAQPCLRLCQPAQLQIFLGDERVTCSENSRPSIRKGRIADKDHFISVHRYFHEKNVKILELFNIVVKKRNKG